MKAVKLLIDGAERGGWKNPEDFSVKIVRDKELNIIYPTYEGEMAFVGETYNYLYSQFEQNGYCNLIDAKLYYQCETAEWKLFAAMKIALSEVSFNLDKCTATCQFIDNSFSAYINNNKAVPFEITTNVTKNLFPIENISNINFPSWNQLRVCNLFNPITGQSFGRGCFGLHIYWVWSNLLAAMSDNTLRFRSDFFSTGGGGVETFITSGGSVRSGKKTPPTVSFETFYKAFQVKYNLAMGFNTNPTTGITQARIEPVSFFENSNQFVTLLNQPGIIRSFDTGRLYATVNFGNDPYLEQWEPTGASISEGGSYLQFPQIKFLGFKPETFGLTGKCNIDTALNLRAEQVVYDPNVIEDILLNGNENFEDTPVVIEVTQINLQPPVTPGDPFFEAKKTDPLGINQTVYNGTFSNEAVAGRWVGGVPSSIWSYYNGFDNTLLPFSATGNIGWYNQSSGSLNFIRKLDLSLTTDIMTAPVLLSSREGVFVQYNTETSDPGTNYDNTVSAYVCPFPMTGIFTAVLRIFKSIESDAGQVIYVRLLFDRYNVNGQLVQRFRDSIYTAYAPNVNDPGPQEFTLPFSQSMFLNEGDVVYVNMEAYKEFPSLNAKVIYNAINSMTVNPVFQLDDPVSVTGGELEQADPAAFRAINDRFTRPLSNAEMAAIINNTGNAIGYTRQQSALAVNKGFINEVNINNALTKRIAEFNLRSNDISMP